AAGHDQPHRSLRPLGKLPGNQLLDQRRRDFDRALLRAARTLGARVHDLPSTAASRSRSAATSAASLAKTSSLTPGKRNSVNTTSLPSSFFRTRSGLCTTAPVGNVTS